MKSSALFFLLLGAMTTYSHSEGHIVDALYDTSVNFTCDPAGLDPNVTDSGLLRIWLLPTAEVVEADTTGHKRVEVVSGGRVLHVRKVNDEDFGVYYCVVHLLAEQRYLAIKHGINVNGPYWGDLLQQYYDNIITAVAAGAVCLVVMGTFCFCYNRHQARGDSESEAAKAESAKARDSGDTLSPQKPMTQYANPAYVTDEVDDGEKKSPAPPSPAQQQPREMQNVVAGVDGGGTIVNASGEVIKTKM